MNTRELYGHLSAQIPYDQIADLVRRLPLHLWDSASDTWAGEALPAALAISHAFHQDSDGLCDGCAARALDAVSLLWRDPQPAPHVLVSVGDGTLDTSMLVAQSRLILTPRATRKRSKTILSA